VTALDAIVKLRGIQQRLSMPERFFAEHLEDWRELARQVTHDTLTALRPPESDPDQWAAGVVTAVARVVTYLLTPEAGMIIALGAPAPDAEPDDPRFFELGGIPVADIERWVRESRAGILPEELAKRLDERDEGKSDLQIAWRILYALKLQKPGSEGLEKAIRRFMGFDSVKSMEAIFPELLRAWLDHFIPRASADWLVWVRKQIIAN